MVTKSRVVVVGAGNICNGFLFHAEKEELYTSFDFLILDNEKETLDQKQKDFPFIQTMLFDADNESISDFIYPSNWVISLLPPRYHTSIAQSCLYKDCHLFTSSYLTDELEEIKPYYIDKGLVLLTELGLDPGIDQILAINSINTIENNNGEIISFKSYAGSYFSSEDPNDWGYRITWNPENVINAGKEETKYLLDGKVISLPYHEVFKESIESFSVLDKELEVYPNRNSLKMMSKYHLPSIDTFIRGTIRKKGFLELWQALVIKGFTNNTVIPQNLKDEKDFRQFFRLKETEIEVLKKLRLNNKSFSVFSNTQQWLLHQLKANWKFDTQKEEEFVFLIQEIGYKTQNQEVVSTVKDVIAFKNDNELSAMSSIVGQVLAYSLDKVYKNINLFLNDSTVVSTSFSNDLLSKVLNKAFYSSNIQD